MHATAKGEDRRFAGTAIQKSALIVGIVFLLVGVAGFIPGLTHQLGELQAAGHGSEAMLFGIFQVSILHNALHLLFGVAGVAVAASALASRNFLRWGGVAYIALWVYGLFAAGAENANALPVNVADNWLHLVLGVGMIALSLFVGHDRSARTVGSRPVS